MRKYAICIVVALAGVAAVSLAQAREDQPIQTLDVSISPSKLDKKKPKPV